VTDIVSLTKAAGISLRKNGLNDLKAAVYLMLDHSGSMANYYARGDVQTLTERALAMAINLDDDGTIPVTYFGSDVSHTVMVRADNHDNIINATHINVPWGSTNYAATLDHAAETSDDVPGLVIFQTDGEPDSRAAAVKALRLASKRPLFFAFVGFGPNIEFLRTLDTLTGRTVDNASFFHAPHPHNVTPEQLYDAITTEFAQRLTAARDAGIL
jgi:uncharacterized protein with von Willebrand factor type A (vWA) domain